MQQPSSMESRCEGHGCVNRMQLTQVVPAGIPLQSHWTPQDASARCHSHASPRARAHRALCAASAAAAAAAAAAAPLPLPLTPGPAAGCCGLLAFPPAASFPATCTHREAAGLAGGGHAQQRARWWRRLARARTRLAPPLVNHALPGSRAGREVRVIQQACGRTGTAHAGGQVAAAGAKHCSPCCCPGCVEGMCGTHCMPVCVLRGAAVHGAAACCARRRWVVASCQHTHAHLQTARPAPWAA